MKDYDNEEETNNECSECDETENLTLCEGCEEYFCKKHIKRIFHRFEIKSNYYGEQELGYFCDECFEDELNKLLKK